MKLPHHTSIFWLFLQIGLILLAGLSFLTCITCFFFPDVARDIYHALSKP